MYGKGDGYPAMIELFAKTDYFLEEAGLLTPIHIDENVSSLSAILLNESIYQLLTESYL